MEDAQRVVSRVLRVGALWMFWSASLLSLTACGAATVRPPKEAPGAEVEGLRLTADGWQRRAERALRRGGDAEALIALRRARAQGGGGPHLKAMESIARWRLGEIKRGAAIDRALIADARADASGGWSSDDSDALGQKNTDALWREVERILAFQLQTRHDPKVAWGLVEQLAAGGCPSARACHLASRVLVASGAHPVLLVERAERVAPREGQAGADGRSRRLRWMVRLGRELIDGRRWSAVDTLLARLHVHWPESIEVWDLGVLQARRQPGEQARRRWLDALRRAKLPMSALLALVKAPILSSDRLLVAEVWGLIATRTDASLAHRLAWAHALAENIHLGSVEGDRRLLKKLAVEVLGQAPDRLARCSLSEALLRAGMSAEASPVVSELMRAGMKGRATLLWAEVLRQRGQVADAIRMAEEASQRAKDQGAMAWRIAELWDATLPAEAKRWSQRALVLQSRDSLSALRQRALHELKRSLPLSLAEGRLVAYARALVDVLSQKKQPGVDNRARRQARLALDGFLDLLLRRAQSLAWRQPVYSALGVLADVPNPKPQLLYDLAVLGFHLRRADEALATYRRLRLLAARLGQPVDDQRMVAAVLDTGDVDLLARWLHLSKLQETRDLNLSWNIAKKLLAGSHRELGRRWVERSLSRMSGEGRLPSRLLSPSELHVPVALASSSSRRLRGRELEEIGRKGAADLVLEYIARRRSSRVQALSLSEELTLGRAEVVALFALGEAKRAELALQRLWAFPKLSSGVRRDLMQLGFSGNLCRLTLAQATILVGDRHAGIVDRAVSLGLSCARSLSDGPGALALAQRLEKAQLSRARHLHLARVLVSQGFDKLALPIFERNLGDRRLRVSYRVVEPWARALFSLGRVRDAVAVLTKTVSSGRSLLRDLTRVAVLIESYGHLARARPFRRRAVAVSGKQPQFRRALIINLLRSGELEELDRQLEEWLKLGPKAEELARVERAALQQGKLRRLYDVLAALVDPDREVERLRMRLAGRLGLSEAVGAAARRLSARGRAPAEQDVRWLQGVGAFAQARGAAQRVLASGASAGGAARAAVARREVLERALDLRRDPSSSAEALSLSRLFVGRALSPGLAAASAAEALASRGEAKIARALREVAIHHSPDNVGLLCAQGRLALLSRDQTGAMEKLRRALAVLLTRGDLRSSRRKKGRRVVVLHPDARCVIEALKQAGQPSLASLWMERWLQFDPTFGDLWARSIDLHVERGQPSEAAAALRRASQLLPTWERARFESSAESVVRIGGGPALARWLLSSQSQLRSEPWWLAFSASVVADHGPALSVSEALLARFQARVLAVAKNSTEARLRLAAMWARRGQARRAVGVMGSSPFALPRKDSAEGESLRVLAAGSAAGVLIALGRAPRLKEGKVIDDQRSLSGQSGSGSALSTSAFSTSALLSRWFGTSATPDDAERMMGALIRQGAPRLAQKVAAWAVRHPSIRLSASSTAHRLLFQLAVGDDEAILLAARRHARTLPSSARGPSPAERVQATVRVLAETGHLSLARQLSQSDGETGPREMEPVFASSKADPRRDDGLRSLLRAWDLRILSRMADPSAPLPARELVLGACEIAIAAGRSDLARGWVRRLSEREDDPWRVWIELMRRAAQFREPGLALESLRQAEQLGAPVGVLACPHLWLLNSGKIQSCLRGRPLGSLRGPRIYELVDLALAVAHGVDPEAAPALLKKLSAASIRVQLQWVGALSMHRWAIRPGDRDRVLTHLRALLAGIALPEQRRTLASVALDDFAALGLSASGLNDAARIFATLPNERGARNNLAYARLLAGRSPSEAWDLALPALKQTAGQSAHALLDTLAACLWVMGHHEGALGLERGALVAALDPSDVASFKNTGFGGLPIVRLAEWELSQGHHQVAATLARLGMARAWMYVTVARAREVLRSSLRAQQKGAR